MSLLPSNFLPDTFGANLIGTMLSCMSFGILLAVAWTYFSRLPKDRWAYKILATLMVIISTTDTVISQSQASPRLVSVGATDARLAWRRLQLHLQGPDPQLQ